MNKDFIIPLNGLKPGKTLFSWHCGKEFFENFGNQDILDADLEVKATVEKSGSYLGADCAISGTVMTLCDRCLDELKLPLDVEALLSVKFGTEPVTEGEVTVSEERETVYLPEDGGDLDLTQTVYDYACISLPMHRVHVDGQCNPLTLRYMSGDDEAFEEALKKTEDKSYSPFSMLKGLMDGKKE